METTPLPELVRSRARRRLAELRADRPRYEWRTTGRPAQFAPDGDWKIWLLLAGRGFGKTRSGAEWVREQVEKHGKRRLALVGPTAADARDVMIEGESGILAISPPWFRPVYEPSKRRLTWPNGAMATAYSADEPERLRGPQHDAAWCDELGAWRYPAAWDMLMFGLRLGTDPRVAVTTTPKPTPLIMKLANDPATARTGGSTYDNAPNLAASFLDDIKRYEGTELGRQEIHAELIDLSANAILKRQWWQRWVKPDLPECYLVIQCYDTAMTDNPDSDYSARTTWGVFDIEDEPNVILLEAWQDKALYPDLRENAQEAYQDWAGSGFQTVVVVEAKNNGFSLCQDLRRGGIPARLFRPDLMGSKLTRAHLTSTILKAGRIWAPAKKVGSRRDPSAFSEAAERVISNCEMFPNLEHDDDVDTCTMAWALLRNVGELTHPDDPEREYVEQRSWAKYLEV